ncbi:hypothetical protein V6N13_131794 [Hibiscus sabdariffa]|uniref:Uncharacterized protein n=1 Tax=Hibiscus sabdariffa TaxID=183260 RepID=A0ABR2D999_9ROSI
MVTLVMIVRLMDLKKSLVALILPLPCQEANKWLSERWAMMALMGILKNKCMSGLRRSSSTLGEMIAPSDTKKLGDLKKRKVLRNKNQGDQLPA